MASAAKSVKDRPHGTPRLMPRPTAASAARAARNATNRNLPLNASQKLSPSRSLASSKFKTSARAASKDSKTDLKHRTSDPVLSNSAKTSEQPEDQFAIPDRTFDLNIEQNVEQAINFENIGENIDFESKREFSLSDEHQKQPGRVSGIPVLSNRPITPTPSSRPHTPKSLPSSRPQTPRVASRPQTPHSPAVPSQRHGTPASRPNTPNDYIRPTTPASQPLPLHTCVEDDEDVKTVFKKKHMEFNQMKKDLDLKQQAILEVFDALRQLRERMSREGISGSGEGQVNELVVLNVTDWTSEEVAQLCREASSTVDEAIELFDNIAPFDDSALTESGTKLTNIPGRFADLCLQAFTARQELIDWIKELIETKCIRKEEKCAECLERIGSYNIQGLKMCDALRELKNKSDDAVEAVTKLSRQACRDRSALVAVSESLVRELAHLRQDMESRDAKMNEILESKVSNEVAKALEETRRELEEEKLLSVTTKEKLATSESQLRQTRVRIIKMDRQLKEAEATIASLTGTVKTLEEQSRQKEVQLEARARKLRESLKTGEVTSGQLAQQQLALQSEIAQLKEHIGSLTTQHKKAIQDLTSQLKEAKLTYENEMKNTQREKDEREEVERTLIESQNTIEQLKATIKEMENGKPNPDLPTQREMDLWAELQATKDILRVTEEEVAACKREKVRFLESLTKISKSETKVGLQQKLAAELLSKEEAMAKMQIQIREMTKKIKLNEQKVTQYQKYVQDLQSYNCAVANCQETPNGISYQDLQHEIMTLKMNVLEAEHRNEELSELLAQKDQQLEQQDKTSRAQARVIKVREELINMLKNKESEQNRELTALQNDLEQRMKIVDDVNKQIAAKAEEIQELFTTLENKQQQIHRLEKIVIALEEQQRRAQAQRTRHEEKIAMLEHELASNQRDRKFLFF